MSVHRQESPAAGTLSGNRPAGLHAGRCLQEPSVSDEFHVQQHGSRCLTRVPPEVRDPVLYRARTHNSVGYWGATRLPDEKMIYRREEGMLHREACAELLHPFLRESTRGPCRAVVNRDNGAHYHSRNHTDRRAEVADRFELAFRPTASPELNWIERVGGAHAAALPPQQVLSQAGGRDDGGGAFLRTQEAGQRSPPATMRN